MEHQIFARRLREAMEKAAMKQVDLIRIAQAEGKKLGKSQVSQYLSGKTIPRQDTLSFLARTLDVAEDWLSPSIPPETGTPGNDCAPPPGGIAPSDPETADTPSKADCEGWQEISESPESSTGH
ncbi:MAG: helix-turn-helix domain-containing protein, partial [Eggerthellaceae bacterium]